ncbi:MAG: acyl-CoA dehydrogenase family protein [Proteobacteria bacterium]|nr:acyl-CoA dehydrogenase family protein [Pseudomonadota bacterium]
MDFELNQDEKQLAAEVEAFLEKELPSGWLDDVVDWPGGYGTMSHVEERHEAFCRDFNRKVGAKGWHSLGWPEEYGGKNSWVKQAVVDDLISYYRAPAYGVARLIAAPTILNVGSDEMKKEWLPRIAGGESFFWLGYSEPNSGSDLASIRTSAVEDGDELVVNGQKIWSTGAHVSDYAWLVARTDPQAPQHKGITLMIIDNKTPGIEIRPLVNICGVHCFNEVFLDNVRVPKANVVGDMNRGFYNLMLALQFERLVAWTGGYRRTFEELVRYARETVFDGRTLGQDTLVRDKLADLAVDIEVLQNMFWKTAWMMDHGRTPEIEASALKLFATELSRKLAGVGMDILGPYGQLGREAKWTPMTGRFGMGYLDSISGPIGAGTSEVQYQVIATRGLGLPRG